MDKRLNEISFQLSEYSLGKFEKRLAMSPRRDEIDAIISCINMLGEELEAITISRNYFTNIFHSVSDMIFILNQKGEIKDANKSAEEKLKYKPGSLIGKRIYDLLKGNLSYFINIKKQLKENDPLFINESIIRAKTGAVIPVRISASYFKGEKNQFIIFTASDITYQIKTENLIIRAIIDTQEAERQRLAKDFHDSILQQLSGIKFSISSTVILEKNQKKKSILLQSNEALTDVIVEMRNICFNLMPNTLKEFGLVKAVKEFSNHILHHKKINLIIVQNSTLPELSHEVKIDIYRVIQEFISNAIKHGDAKKIMVTFSGNKKILKILLVDNGKGFNSKQSGSGMGLQNVESRVKSHSGSLKIASNIGKGTSYTIAIPINNRL